MSFTGNDLWAYKPKLTLCAIKLTHHRASVDDLLQNTFTRAWAKRDLWLGGNLGGWLYMIMRRIWLQDRYDANRERDCFVDNVFFAHVAETNPEERVFTREVLDIIDAFPSSFRATVTRLYAEGHSNKEIAAMLNVPIGTVQSNFFRAREALTKCI